MEKKLIGRINIAEKHDLENRLCCIVSYALTIATIVLGVLLWGV